MVTGNESMDVVIKSTFGHGFASDAEVRAFVGTTTYEVQNCGGDIDERTVNVRLGGSQYDGSRVLDQILRRAVVRAWQRCPKPFGATFSAENHHLGIAAVRIYLADGPLAVEALDLSGQPAGGSFGQPSFREYQWRSWTNYPSTAREQAQRAVAQQRAGERPSPLGIIIGQIVGLLKLVLFGCLAVAVIWIFSKWESILRWWYDLTPHPARGLVDAAIHQGKPIDMEAFDRALVVHPANDIQRSVRERQLREATERLRTHHQALSREEAERVARERALAEKRAEAEREYRMGKAQEEALQAALEHQVTAARVEALRKRERNDD